MQQRDVSFPEAPGDAAACGCLGTMLEAYQWKCWVSQGYQVQVGRQRDGWYIVGHVKRLQA